MNFISHCFVFKSVVLKMLISVPCLFPDCIMCIYAEDLPRNGLRLCVIFGNSA